MRHYKIIVIGGGPAGIMAAIRASQLTENVALFEKNASLARKLGITGKGRCNVTNDCSLEEFLAHFEKKGLFLRDAFKHFFVKELFDFFKQRGCPLKTERQLRVFPVSDKAENVIEALNKALKEGSVGIHLNSSLQNIIVKDNKITGIRTFNDEEFLASRLILATGGVSYPETGSTGDGLRLAQWLGHKIEDLYPGLVPLETKESFVRDLAGLTLKNIRLIFYKEAQTVATDVGEMLFTHFGISGPLVLDNSLFLTKHIQGKKELKMAIDLKPGLKTDQLDAKLLRDFQLQGNLIIRNYLGDLMPKKLAEVFLTVASMPVDKRCHQITNQERRKIVAILKAFPLTLMRSRPISEAMVTGGGVSLKDVNPRTMESKIVAGLYFCGEMLDLAASSGGFNLQAAFSTGYLAGESAAKSLK
jgi:predicted Rossmann fold flavoprotein